MRQATAFFGFCLLAVAFAFAASAQQGPTVGPTYFTATTTGNAITVPLNGGQGTCTVNIYSVGGGTSITAQASSDGTTYVPVTSLGTSGIITTTGTWTGNVSAFGLTQFQLAVTSLVSGSVLGSVSCSTASTASGSGGGGGSSNVVITGVTATNVPVACPSTGCGVTVLNTPAAYVNVAPVASSSPFPVSCSTAIGGFCPTPAPTWQYATPSPVVTATAVATAAACASCTSIGGYLVIPSPPAGQQTYVVYAGARAATGANTNDTVQYFASNSGTPCATVAYYLFSPGTNTMNTFTAGLWTNMWSNSYTASTSGLGIIPSSQPAPAIPNGYSVCLQLLNGTSYAVQPVAIFGYGP